MTERVAYRVGCRHCAWWHEEADETGTIPRYVKQRAAEKLAWHDAITHTSLRRSCP